MVLAPVSLGIGWKLPLLLQASSISVPLGQPLAAAVVASSMLYGLAAIVGDKIGGWMARLDRERVAVRTKVRAPTSQSPGRATDVRVPDHQPGSADPRAPRPKPPPPLIKPATGSVGAASPRGDQVEEAANNDTLLRVLEDGPEAQRQPAARALSIPYADTRDPRVIAALTALLQRDDVGDPSRAEAYLSLRLVVGEEISWEQEVEVRQSFPEGVDWDWVRAQEGEAGA